MYLEVLECPVQLTSQKVDNFFIKLSCIQLKTVLDVFSRIKIDSLKDLVAIFTNTSTWFTRKTLCSPCSGWSAILILRLDPSFLGRIREERGQGLASPRVVGKFAEKN